MPKAKKQLKQKAPKTIAGTRSLSSFVKSICDIMRRSNCASALQYVPELTWILFLRILDAQEKRDREAAEAAGKSFSPALSSPFRWAGLGRTATERRVGGGTRSTRYF